MKKGPLTEGWVKNGPVRLHYIDNQGSGTSTPLVIVPGFANTAEGFAEVVSSLLPRRCVSMSLRGRGKSDTPAHGYSLDDHAQDIASVVAGLGLGQVCVMAHSRGVPYAIAFAAARRDGVRGLVLLDFPARHSRPSSAWADSFLSSDFGKAAVPGRVRLETVRGVQSESGGELLWDTLDGFQFPVLVIRGGKKDSILKEEDAQLYEKHLRRGRLLLFEDSGHDVWKPDLGRFIGALSDFLSALD